MSKYVWYVGYGSNLSKQRFLCYIVGDIPLYGKRKNNPCKDTTVPTADVQLRIPHRLYFALPSGRTETTNWGKGGVAFISPTKEKNENNWSLCRMWKITKEQYIDVWKEEGNSDTWYGKEIFIGNDENSIPILTITNANEIENILPPSDAYIKTVALGLKETFNFDNEAIADYLIGKEGIKGNFSKGELIRIFMSATSSNNRLKD